jgi:two-component system sensor histidine kinase KdpD
LETFVNLIVDLASASLARARVQQEQVRNQAAEQAGKLREALLSSISHDFRSPLAAIIGSSTSLLEYGDKFDEAVRQDLLLNIRDEGEKLNEFVANLLNMIRLQSGVLQPNADRLQASEIIHAAIERLKRHRGKAPPAIVHSDCEVVADPLLLEQAIYNILDNAAKYAATPEGVEITCLDQQQGGQIVIADHGPGLAKEDQAGVFSTFHFARKVGQAKGTGLGLSISRGFIEAMGGTIVAGDRSDGQSGLEIAINLPRSPA